VAGIHRLQHIDGFSAAYLADDNAIRPHAQRVSYQVPLGHFTFALYIGRSGFKPNHVWLLQLQFSRVFNRNYAFILGNVSGKGIQQSCFARSSSS
jgi:hypothetical protein